VDERDSSLETALKEGTHASGFQAHSSKEVTYMIGKVNLQTNRRDLDKQKLLE
jgi:hypothetical protein